jgi:antitoxin MazE
MWSLGGAGMRARIIKIGNSRGIRIPKAFLDQADLTDEVEIDIEKDSLVIHPLRKNRSGWDKAFSKMAIRHDDELLDKTEMMDHSFDEEEWEWQ